MFGDEFVPKSGVLTSPNYPDRYPNHHDSNQTIEVTEGMTIRFAFTHFNTEPEHDYVQLVWGDGMGGSEILYDYDYGRDKWWGSRTTFYNFSSPSNILHVKFHTDGDTQRTGWRLEWNEH